MCGFKGQMLELFCMNLFFFLPHLVVLNNELVNNGNSKKSSLIYFSFDGEGEKIFFVILVNPIIFWNRWLLLVVIL